MANKIVASIDSTATPSLFLHAAYAIHRGLGIIQNEAPGFKKQKHPEISRSYSQTPGFKACCPW